MEHQLVTGDIRIVLHTETNEGYYGDYNSEDPNDELLYRFDVDKFDDGEWQAIDNASYCTRLPHDISNEEVNKALNMLANEIVDPASGGYSIKKICERMSWIEKDWL